MTTTSRASAEPWRLGLIDLLQQWAERADATAVACRSVGNRLGEQLCRARSEVFSTAASLAVDLGRVELARRFELGEREHVQSFGFSGVPEVPVVQQYLDHARAMAWQVCARTVNPKHRPMELPW